MRFSIRQYAEILDKAIALADTDHARERVIKDFTATLVDDARTARLGEILEIWKNLYNKRHGIIDVNIEASDKNTVDFPRSFAGKRVAVNMRENYALLGGSIVRIGDYIIDASIKSKISAIRN